MSKNTNILVSNIPQADRNWFKKYCAKNNTDMSKAIRTFVANLKEKHRA